MKKLVFAFALMLGMGLTSCGNGSEASTEAVDSVEVVADSVETVDTLVVDTVAVDSTL